MTAETERPHGARQRLAEELRAYLILSLYLYLCIGAVFLYRAALLEDHGIGHVALGAAAVKALVLAKFAMLGRAAGIGEAPEGQALLPAVLRASLAMLLVLVLLMLLEELVLGALRHGGLDGAIGEIAGGRRAEVATSVLLLWLILLPLLAFRRMSAMLSRDAMRRLLRGGDDEGA